MGLRVASLLMLWLALSYAHEIRKGRTRNHGHYVCSTWGNNHFKTFDGDIYQFPGICEYNFVSDCRESYKEFSVHIQRALDSNNHPEIQYILITIKDVTVYLKPKLAVVDGRIVKTPYYSSGLLIEINDIYTKVYAKLGMILIWNQEDALMVELDSKFNNHTCGLCGDYNGVPIYNEFINGDASYNSITYGNLQKISKPNARCVDPDETQAIPSCNRHRDECESLLTSFAFADCWLRLNLEMYIQACMQDKCACNGNEDSFCLCSTISEYSRQCSHAGGRPGEWRTQYFCPKTCPETMVYRESSSPCMDTCSQLETSSLCEEHYMDGCFCPEGTVYDDVTEKGCIPASQCHCRLHGKKYSPGESITNECEECTCVSGRWTCKDLPCPGRCSVVGGSHINTFDGKKYTFHGRCYYVLAKGTVNDSYALLAELVPCGSTGRQTCLKTVVLLVDHKKNVVVFRSDGTVLLNEMTVNVPHVSASFSVFKPSSYYLVVQTSFGLHLQIQLLPVMQLFVTVDQSVQGKLQGLCGNFNGMEGDDFRTTSGLVEATGSAFANTWKAQSTCPDQVEKLEDPCSLNIESANYAEHWCSLLKNPEGPFARCHSTIDPSEYYKKCKYDTCLCEDSEECLCAALSSYSRDCAFKGIILGGWRKSVCTSEVSACSGNQIFLYNLTTCQQTCRSLADGEKHCLQDFALMDGCGCPYNTYLDNHDTCVPISKCHCYYKGSYLEPGEYVMKDGERCVCRNAKVQCTSVTVRLKSVTECSSNKTYFDCNTSPDWTSQTPVQLSCHSPQTDYYQAECVSGCVCPEGLFDDGKGGCVEQKDCPCTHNSQWYSPGQKITVDCNTCTCQKGVWSCTEYICYGTCTIYGSGHYITFDDKFYDFDGRCEYVATQDFCGAKNSSGSFSIITENVPCGTTGVTCSKAIKIFLGKTELKLEDKEYKEIQRDIGDDVHYWNRTVGLYLVIEASNGVMLIWDKKTTVFIQLTADYKGKVCGLCGNFDDKSNNDFTTRSGLQETNALKFGNSWKQSPTCPDVAEEIKPCDMKPHRKSWAEKECYIIRSDVFEICHSKVDPMPFYEACVHDACSCDSGGDCECFCSAVAAYAHECTKAEACVFWRTPDICPIFCDYYNPRNECEWHYEPCGSNITTCRMINNVSTNFSVPYLEGCYPRCPNDKPIYNEETKECVPEDQCWCYVNGTHVPPGSEIPTDKNCTKCVCGPSGSIQCTPIPGCPCIINGISYEVGEIVGQIQNGSICITYICAENGSVVTETAYPCPTSTSPTTISTNSPVITLTTTVITTSSSVATTPCFGLICNWTEWFDTSNPEEDDGDYETYDAIRNEHRGKICEAPENIDCRAKNNPDVSLKELGQKVECNITYGLICKNEDQDPTLWPLCFNYEIRVNCCQWREIPCETTSTPGPTPTATSVTTSTTVSSATPTRQPTAITTTPTATPTTTSGFTPTTITTSPADCSCVWTDWIDVSYPNSSDRNSGDYETFESIQKNVPSWSCMKAENISCRAQKFPDVPIENLGQNVECSVTIGLICNNRDQNIGGITPMPVCLNYEISVCCIPNIPACTTTAPSSSTTSTISLPPKSTTTPVPTPSGLPSSTATTTTPPSSTTSSTLGTTTFPGTPAPTPTTSSTFPVITTKHPPPPTSEAIKGTTPESETTTKTSPTVTPSATPLPTTRTTEIETTVSTIGTTIQQSTPSRSTSPGTVTTSEVTKTETTAKTTTPGPTPSQSTPHSSTTITTETSSRETSTTGTGSPTTPLSTTTISTTTSGPPSPTPTASTTVPTASRSTSPGTVTETETTAKTTTPGPTPSQSTPHSSTTITTETSSRETSTTGTGSPTTPFSTTTISTTTSGPPSPTPTASTTVPTASRSTSPGTVTTSEVTKTETTAKTTTPGPTPSQSTPHSSTTITTETSSRETSTTGTGSPTTPFSTTTISTTTSGPPSPTPTASTTVPTASRSTSPGTVTTSEVTKTETTAKTTTPGPTPSQSTPHSSTTITTETSSRETSTTGTGSPTTPFSTTTISTTTSGPPSPTPTASTTVPTASRSTSPGTVTTSEVTKTETTAKTTTPGPTPSQSTPHSSTTITTETSSRETSTTGTGSPTTPFSTTTISTTTSGPPSPTPTASTTVPTASRSTSPGTVTTSEVTKTETTAKTTTPGPTPSQSTPHSSTTITTETSSRETSTTGTGSPTTPFSTTTISTTTSGPPSPTPTASTTVPTASRSTSPGTVTETETTAKTTTPGPTPSQSTPHSSTTITTETSSRETSTTGTGSPTTPFSTTTISTTTSGPHSPTPTASTTVPTASRSTSPGTVTTSEVTKTETTAKTTTPGPTPSQSTPHSSTTITTETSSRETSTTGTGSPTTPFSTTTISTTTSGPPSPTPTASTTVPTASRSTSPGTVTTSEVTKTETTAKTTTPGPTPSQSTPHSSTTITTETSSRETSTTGTGSPTTPFSTTTISTTTSGPPSPTPTASTTVPTASRSTSPGTVTTSEVTKTETTAKTTTPGPTPSQSTPHSSTTITTETSSRETSTTGTGSPTTPLSTTTISTTTSGPPSPTPTASTTVPTASRSTSPGTVTTSEVTKTETTAKTTTPGPTPSQSTPHSSTTITTETSSRETSTTGTGSPTTPFSTTTISTTTSGPPSPTPTASTTVPTASRSTSPGTVTETETTAKTTTPGPTPSQSTPHSSTTITTETSSRETSTTGTGSPTTPFSTTTISTTTSGPHSPTPTASTTVPTASRSTSPGTVTTSEVTKTETTAKTTTPGPTPSQSTPHSSTTITTETSSRETSTTGTGSPTTPFSTTTISTTTSGPPSPTPTASTTVPTASRSTSPGTVTETETTAKTTTLGPTPSQSTPHSSTTITTETSSRETSTTGTGSPTTPFSTTTISTTTSGPPSPTPTASTTVPTASRSTSPGTVTETETTAKTTTPGPTPSQSTPHSSTTITTETSSRETSTTGTGSPTTPFSTTTISTTTSGPPSPTPTASTTVPTASRSTSPGTVTTSEVTKTETTAKTTTPGPTPSQSTPHSSTTITTETSSRETSTTGTGSPTTPFSTTTISTTTSGPPSPTPTASTTVPTASRSTSPGTVTETETTAKTTTPGPTPSQSTPHSSTTITTETSSRETSTTRTGSPTTPFSTTTISTTTSGPPSPTPTASTTVPTASRSTSPGTVTTSEVTKTETTAKTTTLGPTPSQSTPHSSTTITTETSSRETSTTRTGSPTTPFSTTTISTTTSGPPSPTPTASTTVPTASRSTSPGTVTETETTAKTTTLGPTPSQSTPHSSTTITTETSSRETSTTGTGSPTTPFSTTTISTTTSGPPSPTPTASTTVPTASRSTSPGTVTETETTAKTTTPGPTPSQSTPHSSTTITTETSSRETSTTGTGSPTTPFSTTTISTTTSGPPSPTPTASTTVPTASRSTSPGTVTTSEVTKTETTAKTTTPGPTPSQSTPHSSTTIITETGSPMTTTATFSTPTRSPAVTTTITSVPPFLESTANTTPSLTSVSASSVPVTTSGTTPTESFTTTSGTTFSNFTPTTATTTTSTSETVSAGSTSASEPTATSSAVTIGGSSTHTTVTPLTPLSSTTTSPPTTPGRNCSIFPNESHAPGESWQLCNCTKATCIEDNVVRVVPIICNPPPKPTCSNGLSPVRVIDKDGCCWHWECDCYCTGWGDPHYLTFDGLYYSYQGNCTYVLMEEINKTVDNFGVYIDNYHCDSRDVVSCPRTLIVRHETQEVRIATIKPNALQVEVTVNKQAVALPYKKFGLIIYESGINRVVEIPELNVNVTYNGLSFSIRMPYQKFGNNTQGQCGTCNNNTADDCMLPNGNIAENCETMADHWQVVDPSKPQCSPGLIPTKAPNTTPMQSCKGSSICELLLGSLFKPCHGSVQPEKYYAACVFDSCVLPNLDLECSSLQIYAATCADQGVCIDWRSHTNGVCSYKCPSDKEYRACGPIKEVTCKSSHQNETSTKQVEGCFCPNGTMLYDSGVDVCVETCGCVGVDMIPREFGERFMVDCYDCLCVEGGYGIVCEPHECAEQSKTNCDGEGFYEVNEVNPEDSCCPIVTCKCNTSLCTTKAPKCTLGFEVHSHIPSGQCCPVYQCVPKRVCVHQNAEFLPNSSVFVDKCQNCFCTNEVNISTQLNIISCEHIPCNIHCGPGYEIQPVKGECCGRCVQTKCVIHTANNSDLILSPGEFKNDPYNNCTIYSCVNIHNQFISSTSEITCPAFNEDSCKPGTIAFLPNGCCKTCAPLDSPTPCSVRQREDFIVYNGCRSVDRVVLTECEGTCGTSSLYSAEANSMEHSCSCCRESRTTVRDVELKCPSGRSISHKYIYVESCSCRDTECSYPQSSELQTTEENDKSSALNRIKRAISLISE